MQMHVVAIQEVVAGDCVNQDVKRVLMLLEIKLVFSHLLVAPEHFEPSVVAVVALQYFIEPYTEVTEEARHQQDGHDDVHQQRTAGSAFSLAAKTERQRLFN